jgi:2-aminoadipate transaminase
MIEPDKPAVPFSEAALRVQPDVMAPLFGKVNAAVQEWQSRGERFISLAVGAPDPTLLPHEELNRLRAKAAAQFGPNIGNYTHPQGLPPFRQAMARFLEAEGLKACGPENILATSGGLDGLTITARIFLNSGDTVITEGPGFASLLSKFHELGANVIQLDVDEEGVRPDELEAAIKQHKPKLISLMPDYLNPTGAVMSLARRKAIGEIISHYGIFAVEDATYKLLGLDEGEARPPLQAFAEDWVVYVTSGSKVAEPSLRVGVMACKNRAVIEKALEYKSATDMQASGENQAVLGAFFDPSGEGCLTHELARRIPVYRARRDAMLKALADAFPAAKGWAYTKPKGGMFIWLTGPEGTNFTTKADDIIANGTAIAPGSMFYADDSVQAHHRSARLNFASTPEEDIPEAIRRLAVAMGL